MKKYQQGFYYLFYAKTHTLVLTIFNLTGDFDYF